MTGKCQLFFIKNISELIILNYQNNKTVIFIMGNILPTLKYFVLIVDLVDHNYIYLWNIM